MSGLDAELQVVGPRWALLAVERLLDGPQRYGDLQRDLEVPTDILATRLRELRTAVLPQPALEARHRGLRPHRSLALRDAIVALAAWGDEVGASEAGPVAP